MRMIFQEHKGFHLIVRLQVGVGLLDCGVVFLVKGDNIYS